MATAAGIATGIVEIVLGIILFVTRFHQYRFAQYQNVHAPLGSYGEAMVLGLTLLLGFCFSPLGVVAVVLFVEGIVRAAAGVAGISVGTSALFLAERAWTFLRRPPPLPSPPPDRLARDGDGWVVECGRQRDWDELTTFVAGGAHFRLLGVSQASLGARPWRYRLGPVPSSWIVRRQVSLD
jgi:hypothetical protein